MNGEIGIGLLVMLAFVVLISRSQSKKRRRSYEYLERDHTEHGGEGPDDRDSDSGGDDD